MKNSTIKDHQLAHKFAHECFVDVMNFIHDEMNVKDRRNVINMAKDFQEKSRQAYQLIVQLREAE